MHEYRMLRRYDTILIARNTNGGAPYEMWAKKRGTWRKSPIAMDVYTGYADDNWTKISEEEAMQIMEAAGQADAQVLAK